jgi:hypothetical protein
MSDFVGKAVIAFPVSVGPVYEYTPYSGTTPGQSAFETDLVVWR